MVIFRQVPLKPLISLSVVKRYIPYADRLPWSAIAFFSRVRLAQTAIRDGNSSIRSVSIDADSDLEDIRPTIRPYACQTLILCQECRRYCQAFSDARPSNTAGSSSTIDVYELRILESHSFVLTWPSDVSNLHGGTALMAFATEFKIESWTLYSVGLSIITLRTWVFIYPNLLNEILLI